MKYIDDARNHKCEKIEEQATQTRHVNVCVTNTADKQH
jgi:hypothetical protein